SNHTAIASYMRSAIPPLSRISPSSIKSGIAVITGLLSGPQTTPPHRSSIGKPMIINPPTPPTALIATATGRLKPIKSNINRKPTNNVQTLMPLSLSASEGYLTLPLTHPLQSLAHIRGAILSNHVRKQSEITYPLAPTTPRRRTPSLLPREVGDR